MFIDIDKIKVSGRIRKDYGDIDELADDIAKNGLINPPAINKDYQLLAGERRLRACKKLGWKQIPVNMIDTENEEQDLSIEISENEARKEFTMTERLAYARKLTEIESKKAKERQKATQFGSNTVVADSATTGKTREKVAKAVGLGKDKLRQAQFIEDNKHMIDAKDFADWDDGKLSTNKVYNQLKDKLAKVEKELEERPEKIVKVEDEEDKKEIERLKKRVEGKERDFKFLYEQHTEMIQKNTNLELKIMDMKEQHEKEMEALTKNKAENYIMNSVLTFYAGVSNFMEQYGGYIWLSDQLDAIPEKEREPYLKAVNALEAWIYQMKQNLKGE